MVSEEICALSTTVAVIDRKKGTPWPEFKLLELRLDDVQDNWDSVFIVVAHHALVGIGCVRSHYSIFLARKFSWVVSLFESLDLSFLHGNVLFSLAQSHLHTSVLHNCRLVVFIIAYLRPQNRLMCRVLPCESHCLSQRLILWSDSRDFLECLGVLWYHQHNISFRQNWRVVIKQYRITFSWSICLPSCDCPRFTTLELRCFFLSSFFVLKTPSLKLQAPNRLGVVLAIKSSGWLLVPWAVSVF